MNSTNQIIYELIADATKYVAGSNVAAASGDRLGKVHQELEARGIQTTKAIMQELRTLERLRTEMQRDVLVVAQLDREKAALIRQLQRSTAETDRAARGFGMLSGRIDAVRVAAGAFVGSQVARYVFDAGRAAVDADRAFNIMRSSVEAARREFGDSVGTVKEWETRVEHLAARLGTFSRKDVTEAATKTLDMTKRLGLNAEQMEIVLERAAALSIGKTNLASAVERVTSALRGEAESAELLSLSLSEPALKTFLLANGFEEKLIPKLTEAQKAQFRYMMFLQQSNEVQDRAAELSETQAGKMDRLSTKFKEGVVNVGNFALKAAEFAGLLDLLNGDLERYGANAIDIAMLGMSGGVKKTLDQTRRELALLSRPTRFGETGLASHERVQMAEGVVKAKEKEKTVQEQIAEAVERTTKEIMAALAGERDKKGLLEQQVLLQKELRFQMTEIQGEGAKRIVQKETQNRLDASRIALALEEERMLQLIGTAEGKRLLVGERQLQVFKEQWEAFSQQEYITFLATEEGKRLLIERQRTFELKQQVQYAERLARIAAGLPVGLVETAPKPRDMKMPDDVDLDVGGVKLEDLYRPTNAYYDHLRQTHERTLKAMGMSQAEYLFQTQEGLETLQALVSTTFGGFRDLSQTAFEAGYDRDLRRMQKEAAAQQRQIQTMEREAAALRAQGYKEEAAALLNRAAALTAQVQTEDEMQARARARNEAAFLAYKGIAIAEAIASTYVAANKALAAAPPPFNYALMAGVIASGLTNVARIRAATPGSGGGGYSGTSGQIFNTGGLLSGDLGGTGASASSRIGAAPRPAAATAASAAQMNRLIRAVEQTASRVDRLEVHVTADARLNRNTFRSAGREDAYLRRLTSVRTLNRQ